MFVKPLQAIVMTKLIVNMIILNYFGQAFTMECTRVKLINNSSKELFMRNKCIRSVTYSAHLDSGKVRSGFFCQRNPRLAKVSIEI